MTIKKLSALAGVSPATVSKAFNGAKDIGEKTREKIFALAKQYNCYEKYNKVKYPKKVVAVICPEVESEFYANLVSYIKKCLNKLGIIMVLSISEFSAEKERELISYHLSCKNADGILVLGAHSKIKYNKDVPIVDICSSPKIQEIDCVNMDLSSAISDAVLFFKNNGHKDIGYIGEKLTNRRKEYFEQALLSHNLEINPDFIVVSEKRFNQAGYSAMQKIYSLEKKPTAILCAYDYIALGAMDCISDHNESVPENFSIIGIDDISFSSNSNVNLSSIKPNIEEICNIAIDLLVKKIREKTYLVRQSINVRGELVNRASVKNLLVDK